MAAIVVIQVQFSIGIFGIIFIVCSEKKLRLHFVEL